jgi:hypothetical protein
MVILEKTCKYCGVHLKPQTSTGRIRIYCSVQCKRLAYREESGYIPPRSSCKHCGKELKINSGVGRKKIYCSIECRRAGDHVGRKNGSSKRIKYSKKCPQCEKEFNAIDKNQIYCSVKCRFNSITLAPGECAGCGKIYKKTSRQRKYCSQKCYSLSKTKPKEEKLAYRRFCESKRRKEDIKFQIKSRMRCQIWLSLKHGKGGKKWEELVGYTVDDLKRHLERQFRGGMSWDRFMSGDIHIDHIIPIDAFNFASTDDLDFKRCWSLKNLQPLWVKENLSKGSKLIKPFQPYLSTSL